MIAATSHRSHWRGVYVPIKRILQRETVFQSGRIAIEIDRKLLNDKAYVVRTYAEGIVRNAKKIETLLISRRKFENIEWELSVAASNIREFSSLLENTGGTLSPYHMSSDREDDDFRDLAARYRESEKIFRRKEAEEAAAEAAKEKTPKIQKARSTASKSS